jgi:hypothetical protein
MNVIMSAEEFSFLENFSNHQGVPFFRILKQALELLWDIDVIICIVSFWNERHKYYNYGESLVEWCERPTSHYKQFQNDCLAVYNNMKRHFNQVSILNVHYRDPLTTFCCSFLPNATHP